MLREKIGRLQDELYDQIADLIIDFLENQHWPMEILTPVGPVRVQGEPETDAADQSL